MSATLPPLVLSIQSHVAWGHVGNAAAVFPLQRLGFEVLPIHTVQFSNHTGYGQFRGQVFGAEHVREVLLGLRERGVLPRLAAVLSGYLGDADTGRVILEAVGEIRQHNPGSKPANLQEAVKGARQLRGRGPGVVIVTSLSTPDIPESELGTLAVNGEGAWLVSTPRLALHPLPNGMGDVFSATLLGRLLAGQSLPQALELATATLYALVEQTADGARDLPLVAAQEQIVAPGKRFVARQLSMG